MVRAEAWEPRLRSKGSSKPVSGLIPAIAEELPKSKHKHCVRHLHNNMKKHHAGQAIKEKFGACAKSCHENKFKDNMEALKALDKGAHDWLVRHSSLEH